MNKVDVKPRWTAIEIDETQYSTMPEIKYFGTIYFFDRNLITRICSQDKHYYLMPMYQMIQFHDNVSQEDQDKITEDLGCEIGDPDYFMECDIEKMIADGPGCITEWTGEDMTEDEIREYWQGNCPI